MHYERHDFPTLAQCCHALAEHIVTTARRCVADHGRFAMAASGGDTPKPLYRLLAAPPFVDRMPWDKTHLFWGDERCVDPTHPDSNYRMAQETLLAHPLSANCTIHRMPGELPPKEGAASYEEDLRRFFGSGMHEKNLPPTFDLILLGLGSDGHTASLFPNAKALAETGKWVTATPPGDLPPQVERLTLTIPVINQAAEGIFLIAGVKKKELAAAIIADRQSPPKYPAGRIAPQGKLIWYIADA
ncbi:MAG: 6-phosphogluconolactonase [Desulfobulbaceae bacterium]|nr:6-phosphogluconolactonase [Desulfobulbaceae bacterium]